MFSAVNVLCASSISIWIVKENASARHATDSKLVGGKPQTKAFRFYVTLSILTVALEKNKNKPCADIEIVQ